MKLRITSISFDSYGAALGGFTVKLEKHFDKFFVDKDYGGGLDQISLIFVCLGEQHEDNEVRRLQVTKRGRYKDFYDGHSVAYRSIGISIRTTDVPLIDGDEGLCKIAEHCYSAISLSDDLSKGKFDKARFVDDFRRGMHDLGC